MSKEEKETQKPEEKPVGPPKSIIREYFESFVVTLVMAIFGMTFVLQAVTVPTGSMQNTILIGDYLYGYSDNGGSPDDGDKGSGLSDNAGGHAEYSS